MNPSRRTTPITIALYAIAALLLANLVATFSRHDAPALLPAAYAQRQAPIAGGAGFFVMPAQLNHNTWGCYLMDVDRGTLCVYQFQPGQTQLRFVASRNFRNDIQLSNYNTTPSPHEVADLVDKQNQGVRGAAVVPPLDDRPHR
jgi:hypothetical protein